jgi:hypothetical protein
MTSNLHLVVELGTWVPQGGAPEDLSKLEAHLAVRPEMVFTLVTRNSLPAALASLRASWRYRPGKGLHPGWVLGGTPTF